MSRVYDNWERLVEAVLKREQLKYLALCESFSSISTDFSSRLSFDSFHENVSASGISSNTVDPGAPSGMSNTSDHGTDYIEFEEIRKATKSFKHYTVEGKRRYWPALGWIDEQTLTASKPGFGKAVGVSKKNLEGMQGLDESIEELILWSQLQHPNVVRLIGYCCEIESWYWVYEFMPLGSLDNHLFKRGHESLSWERRIKVAVGIARGLAFLHDRKIQVVHRNVQSSVILLDEEYNAKLYDFSLAEYSPTGDMTHIITPIVGTYGCAAPEYVMKGHLTAKSDVYSFGFVLLELLCGHQVLDKNIVNQKRGLIKWAKPYLGEKEKLSQIIDAALQGQYPEKGAYKMATLASRCLNFDPKRRPQMAQALAKLEQL